MPPSARQWEGSPHDGTIGFARLGYPIRMSEPLQNDPDRAGGLVSGAQGEFVEEQPGGAFDPRAFRRDSPAAGDPPADDAPAGGPHPGDPRAGDLTAGDLTAGDADHEPGLPPVNDQRMSSPRQENEKTG
jgi:hypothetical protein